jgi:5-keto 4-deoxyuronate isomerase
LSQPSEPEEEKFCGRNIIEKSGILSRATFPLSLRSQDSSSSRKANQVVESSVVNNCICDKGLGKTKSKPSLENNQENRAPCHFCRRDSEAWNITE